MKKRFTFQCWNCPRTYTLFREITPEQVLTVACPYCNEEGIVKLEPYKVEKKSLLRGREKDASIGSEYQLPEVIPTQKPEPGQT